MNRQLSLGAVSYLNTRPLVQDLEDLLPEGSLQFDLPSRLAARLGDREFDVALVPVIALASGIPYVVVSDACIACEGPVWSVKLLSRVPPEQIRTVALDEGSRTSVVLTRLLLRHHWKVTPELQPLPMASDWRNCTADAVLIIGDRAMHDHSADFRYQWDLGEQWLEWTGLPFVFAVWAAHPEVPLDRLALALGEARDRGEAAADRIAESRAAAYGLSVAQCRTYLTEHLRFRLGSRERQALTTFLGLAAENGLIPVAPEIRYHHDCPVA